MFIISELRQRDRIKKLVYLMEQKQSLNENVQELHLLSINQTLRVRDLEFVDKLIELGN
jgi:hypothetical protein